MNSLKQDTEHFKKYYSQIIYYDFPVILSIYNFCRYCMSCTGSVLPRKKAHIVHVVRLTCEELFDSDACCCCCALWCWCVWPCGLLTGGSTDWCRPADVMSIRDTDMWRSLEPYNFILSKFYFYLRMIHLTVDTSLGLV